MDTATPRLGTGNDAFVGRTLGVALTMGLVVIGPTLLVISTITFLRFDQMPSLAVRSVVLAGFVYVLVVAGMVLHRLSTMITERRRESAGSRLHLRLARVFALVAMVPTILVAVFATLTVNFGLESWFSERVRQVVGNSLAAAQAYEAEHRFNLTSDAELLANYLNQQKIRFPLLTPGEFRDLLNRGQLQMQRELSEAYVIDGDGTLRARGERSYLFNYDAPPRPAIERAQAGETVLIEDRVQDEFRALVALPAFADRYLYVSRSVDGDVLDLLDETQETVTLYERLERDRGQILLRFAFIYLGFAVVLILAAIWFGLLFAKRLARPVGRLAGAAQQVGAGDLDVQVEETGDDEIAMLSRIFNRMTKQVKGQRDALMRVNEETERGRRVIDSILSGVTAGVIGLDSAGEITLMNAAGLELLSLDAFGPQPSHITDAVPEFSNLFKSLQSMPHAASQHEIRLNRHGREKVLLVRMAARFGENGLPEGYVITFDDISDLVTAQRMAAWGDVARRIAHEIKNPLTPIQLSAERMRRKFGPKLGEERAALEAQTDIIIRQTGDLRRIVDEFSKFARMPTPERSVGDVMAVLRAAVLLQQSAAPHVRFRVDGPEGTVLASFDETLISQALTNLLKNAVEAIEEAPDKPSVPEVRATLAETSGVILLQIQDNGMGLPEARGRLFEPYVTHRAKGTGLGLSIVKKIIEDHDGQLELLDAPVFEGNAHAGAEARVVLPQGLDALGEIGKAAE